MPDISSISLPDLIAYLKTGVWLGFYAVWLSIALEHLRNPKYGADYSPYMAKFSTWVQELNPLQMQTFSLVAFFVPVGLAALVINFVPYDFWIAAQPVFKWLVLAVLAYMGQQWFHLSQR